MIQKKKLVSIVCIIAVVAIACAMVFSFDVSNNSNNVVSVDDANVSNVAWGPSSKGSIGYASNGDGLEDGSVPSGYTGTGTPISNSSSTKRGFKDSNSYYLTEDIDIGSSGSPVDYESGSENNGSRFSGTFDGCGHTVKLYLSGSHMDGFWGGMFGVVHEATIKNTKFVIYQLNHEIKDGTGKDTYIGAVAGLFKGSTLENCSVTLMCNAVYSTPEGKRPTSGHESGFSMFAGWISNSSSKSTTITKMTIDFQGNTLSMQNGAPGSGLIYPDFNFYCGGLAGRNDTALSITNLKINGSGNVSAKGTGRGGNERAHLGACIGYSQDNGAVTINGLIYSFTGTVSITNMKGTKNANSFIGTAKSISTSNVFKNASSADIKTQSSTVSVSATFSLSEGEIGFCRSDNSKMWIGQLSSYDPQKTGQATTGKFVDTVTINSTVYDTREVAAGGVGDRTIPIISKGSVSSNVSYTYNGMYAGVINQTTAITSSINSSMEQTSTNTGKCSYIGKKDTGITTTNEIYREGSSIGQTAKVGGYDCTELNAKDVGTHIYNSSKTGGVLLSSYYVVYNVAYSINIVVEQADAPIDSSRDTRYVFDGMPHGITVSATGLKESENFEDLLESGYASIQYSKDSATYQTSPITITDVKDSGKVVYYKINFTNYKTITGSKTITITPADVTMDVSLAANYSFIYTTNSLYTSSSTSDKTGITTVGKKYFNELLKACQTSPETKLEYSNLIDNEELNIIMSATDIRNVGSYSITISKGETTGVSNFAINTTYTIPFSIVKAQAEVGFTSIAGFDYITTSGIGSNDDEGKFYNFMAQNVPDNQYAQIIDDEAVLWSLFNTFSWSSYYGKAQSSEKISLDTPICTMTYTAVNSDLSSIKDAGEPIQDAGTYIITYTYPVNNNVKKAIYTYTYTINQTTIELSWTGDNQKVYNGVEINPYTRINPFIDPLLVTGIRSVAMEGSRVKIITSDSAIHYVNVAMTNTFLDNQLNSSSVSTILNSGSYTISFSIAETNDLTASSLNNVAYMVTQAKLLITLDDTKTLYDSILDATKVANPTAANPRYYDFIYVNKDARIDSFASDYSKYFTKVSFFNTSGARVASTFSNYLYIQDIQYVSSSDSVTSATSYVIKYAWKSGVDSLYINNYSLGSSSDASSINYITTGASRNTSTDQDGVQGITGYDYGEDAVPREGIAFVRILIIPVSSTTGGNDYNTSKDRFNSMSINVIDPGSKSNVAIFDFIYSRYYDRTTYSQTTTYKLAANITFNTTYNGSRILPSYKTIDGNGHGIYNYYLGNTSDKHSSNAGIENVGYSETTVGYTSDYLKFTNDEFRGYASVNGEKYYGVGMLLAVNYGTLQNIFLYTYMDVQPRSTTELGQYQDIKQYVNGYPYANTSIGNVVGINKGIIGTKDGTIKPVEVYQGREQKIYGDPSYKLSYGLIAGSNDGTMQYIYVNTPDTVTNSWIQTSSYKKESQYPSTLVTGSALSAYFGLYTGINDTNGIIQNTSYTSPYKGESGLDIPADKNYYSITKKDTIKSMVILAKNSNTTIEKYAFQTGATTQYMGGVTGYNLGKIHDTSITNQGVFASTGSKNSYLGGIAGYNKGNGDDISGVIQNCSFRNEGTLIAGADDIAMNSYAVGGIAGVTSSGYISNCGFTNVAGALLNAKSSKGSDNGLYVGGLIGVGCEEGTVDATNPMKHNGDTIGVGKLLDCTSFNFASIGANWGSWGYIAGRYNTILYGSDGSQPASDTNSYTYVHRYGNLIWYTSNTPQKEDGSYYQKQIFDGIAGIMGTNTGLGNGSDNVYISGIAGIGIADCGDGAVGSAMLNSISLSGDTITVGYKGPNTLGYTGYQGMDATIELEDGTQKPVKINNKDYETSLSSNGKFTFSAQDANAIIYSTKNPATTCDVLVRLYVLINNEAEYKSFMGDSETASAKGEYNNYIYCAGYGILSANLVVDSNQKNNDLATNIVLNYKKTLRGRSFNFSSYNSTERVFEDGDTSYTITYTWGKDDATVNYGTLAQVSNGTNTIDVNAVGNVVGRNEGIIEYMTIVVDPTYNAGNSNRHQSITIQAGTNVAFGVLCGINQGILRNNKVSIGCNYGAKVVSSSGTTLGLVGGLCGLNDRGSVINNEVSYVTSINHGNVGKIYVASTSYETTALSYGVVGGAIGVTNGGIVKGLTVKGLGSVHTNKTLFTYSNVGGAVGYMPLVDNLGLASFTLLKVEELGAEKDSISGINVALTGGVECWNSVRGGSGLVFGKCITSMNQANADLVARIFKAHITAVCLGDVDAFQVSGRYENSLYGVVEDYSKDQSATLNREKHDMAKATNRIVLQDGSEYGQGYEALTSGLEVTCSNYIMTGFKITLNWASTTSHVAPEQLASQNISCTPTVGDTGLTLTGLSRASSAVGYYYVFNIQYSVNIAGENISYNNLNALKDSPIINFVAGRGNLPLYAGATTGNLQGDVVYDKKVTSTIEMTSRKTLNGGGHYFISYWIGDTDNQIAGLTEDSGGSAAGNNLISNVGEYPKWYEGTNGETSVRIYGISDFISINRGTINNLKVKTRDSANQHYYKGLIGNGANVAYGSFCGVNLGIINNCSVELNSPTVFTYESQEATCDLLVSPGVGINRGSIDGFNIKMENTYTITGFAKNVTIGGAVALNGVGSSLKNAEVTINGSFNRNVITYDSSSNLLKDNLTGAVVFGGIVGVNDGGAVQYTKISGSGTINVSNPGYELYGTQDVEGKDENGNTIIVQEQVRILYEDTKFMFFAMGIAISNNIEGTTPEIAGHAIHDCVDGTTNKVHDMIIQFNGNMFYTLAGKYMLGLAFAKASSKSAETTSSPAYKNIFITSDYSSYSELLNEGGYRQDGLYQGYVIGAGLPFMGHVDSVVTGNTSFVYGGRVEVNADYSLGFGSNENGNLIIQTNDANISRLDYAYIEEMPLSTIIKTYTQDNTSYLSFAKASDTGYVTLTLKPAFLNEVFNNNGYLTQIEIEYYFPTVLITDIFQLMQYMKYNPSNSSSDVKTGFVEAYKAQIAKVFTSEKQFIKGSKEYGVSWASNDATTISALNQCGYTDSDIYTYDSTHLLLVEKYKCADGSIVSYYAALKAELGVDLILNKYTYNSTSIDVNIGWNSTQYFEFNSEKTLDGKGYSVTIVANTFAQQMVMLSDVAHTPSVDVESYLAGGFVGVNRGIIKNVNFKFKEGSVLTIANSDYSAPDLERSIFVGVVCAYSSGKIDNCTLTMEDNTQVYVYKRDIPTNWTTWPSNNSKYTTNLLGAFTGLLGKGSTISNCTLTMGDNSILIMNSRGSTNGGGSRGSIFNYVGGFAGMMLHNSYMYNLKIEGSASSLLGAVGCTDDSGTFNDFHAATGGVIGCNSSSSTWNPKGLGSGTIDGVIFNWKGACLNTTWYNAGWGGSTVGGNRSKMTVTYYGGSCIGVTDDGASTNFYYTFDISTFGKDYTTDFTNGISKGSGIYIHNNGGTNNTTGAYYPAKEKLAKFVSSMTYYTYNGSSYVKVENPTEAQFNSGAYYTTRTYLLNLNYGGGNIIDSTNKYAICFSDILESATASSSKIPTKTLRVFEMTNENVIGTGLKFDYEQYTTSSTADVYKGISNFSDGGAYTELTTLGDALKWADKTIGSDIKCEFEVQSEDTSAIMWSINIYGATSEGNKLMTSKNTVTEIPVYRFASSIENAKEYKKFNYQIQRGEGDGMRLYYCTGNAAILSPDKNYYSNEYDKDITTYHPLKAVMYDGKTDASNVAVEIYNQNGQSITRLSSSIASNIFATAKANGNIKTTYYVKNAKGEYVESAASEELKKIGSYKVQYDIYAKDNEGNIINPNAYVSKDYRTEFFSSDGKGANSIGLVESYVIFIVIAPISIYVTSIQKFYDGSDAIHYEYGTNSVNSSKVEATIDHTFTYVASEANPTISNNSQGGISLSTNSSIKLTIDGKYDSPEVGDRTATINMGGNITYSIYEKRDIGWVEKIVTAYYVKDKSGTTNAYFTLYELSQKVGEATIDNPKEYYYYNGDLTNGFAMSSKDAGRVVRINQANAPTIEATFADLLRKYTGYNIALGAELSDYIKVTDSYGQVLDTSKLITSGELTITIKEITIKDVKEEGYSVEVEIKYVGSNMATASCTKTIKVYVTPAEIKVDRVIKEYDKTTATTNATFVVSGLLGADTNTGIEATYANANVGTGIVVNITTTAITIQGTQYNTLFGNYYLSSKTPNVGTITPAGANVLNAYKTYDGGTTLSYTSSGTTQASSTLVTSEKGEVLNYKLSGEYSSNQVGQCSLNVSLEKFDYIDAAGSPVSLYRIKDSGVATNYCIKNANSTSYSVSNIAYIVPAPVSIGYVVKEYDGTTALGTFESITGLISTDSSIKSFDGEYASKDVVYSSGAYNNIKLKASSYTYKYNNGSSVVDATVYRLLQGGTASNYMLNLSDAGVSVGETCTITGKGVIIPKLITLTNVTKVYDGKYRFDSSDKNVTATFNIDGAEVTTYYITGKMSGKDATNGTNLYDVILENSGSYIDYTPFIYDGIEYVWLTNAMNSEHNYRLADTTIPGVGDVTTRRIDIVTGSTTSDGALSKLGFTKQGVDVYVANGTDYLAGQTYGTSNFIATLLWNGQTAKLSNGSVTIDGTTMTFSLDKTVTNAGTHTFTISMTSSQQNFEFTNSTFSFTIRKQTISDSSKVSAVLSNISKVYDGTSSLSSISMGSLTNVKAVVNALSGTDTVSFTSYSITSSGGINNSGITMANSSGYINAGTYTPTLSVSISASTSNYTFSGKISNIYASSGSTTKTSYTITQRALTVSGTFEKEFDGSTKGLRVNGVAGEVLVLSYSSSDIKLLPGEYTGNATYTIDDIDVTSAQNKTSVIGNYTVSSSTITIKIGEAKVALERQYSSTNANVNYFAIKLALLNLKSLQLFVDETCTAQMLNSFIESKALSEENAAAIKAAVAKYFVLNVNDSPLWSVMTASQIKDIVLYAQQISEEESVYTLEISIDASQNIDLETYTDRIAAVMYDNSKSGASTLEEKYCSNISVSSSELAEGQFSGVYTSNEAYTAISTPDELKSFLATSGTGYLTNNIYGFDNASTIGTTFSGKLYGNGYTITLNGGLNQGETNSAFFVAVNAGTIQDVNFKFVSTSIISKDIKTPVAVIAGTNSGKILNCSLDMAKDIAVEEGSSIASFAGFAIENTNIIENVAITYSTSIATAFSGIAASATASSTINYIAVRENKYVVKTFGENVNAIGANIQCTIAYAIDAILTTHTNATATITKLYGDSNTKLSMFSETYTNGYIDYYFSAKGKYTTNGYLHNVYETETDANKTYYYGYDSSAESYRVAIETIAPLNRFIWEAYDANYLTYGTSLNRTVALFNLDVTLQDSADTAECELNSTITFITSTKQGDKTIWVTIFNPAIGIIAEAVISGNVDTIQEYEYTGSTISASFTATIGDEEKVLTISGTEVGVYTEYFEESNKEVSSTSREFDASTRTAKILSSSSGTGSATIMLIITPKTINNAPTLEKQYDSTTIAETAIDTTGDGVNDIYAIGAYSSAAVGEGYSVSYNSYTRPVAAQLVNGEYKFIICYLSGVDSETGKKIYTVKYSTLTSKTNITSLSISALAREYNQLVTYEYLDQLEKSQNVIMNYNELSGVTSVSNLTTAYVYDLAFKYTTNNGKVTYSESGIYYAYTMFNVSLDRNAAKTINANYKWAYSEYAFTGTTLLVSGSETQQTSISNNVSTNGGKITQRTITATYSNLNQSYRKQLSAITVEVAEVSELTNIPYSLTTDQYTQLIAAINNELKGANFNADVLGATISEKGQEIIKGNKDDGYFATKQEYAQIELVALTGNYSVTTNLAVQITGGATLTLRYFEYDSTNKRFIIDTIDALLMIDSDETGNDYQSINYIVKNDINAKSRIITTFTHVFNGSINGNEKKIMNMVLVGDTAVSLFGTLGESAYIYNLSFVNTFVLVRTTGTATASIVANTNNATGEEKGIQSVKAEGYIYSIANAITISPIAANGSGKVSNNVGFVQTNMAKDKTTLLDTSSDKTSELVVMFRSYGNKIVANNIVAVYINGVGDKSYSNISGTTQTFINECIINAPLTITNTSGTVTVKVENFRQYWAYINICPWLAGSNVATFIGYQFELNT
ncbi:MAG: hypothetical protein MSH40_05210 [Christensenella sp.]|nr:hypothetical protein [Christensenella sp.]